MRLTRFHAPTLKETPADAEVVSHQLMLRAGMIRLVHRGCYDFLPLGLRVIRKIEQIVREEMDRAGANEVLVPIVQPKELWLETGRWQRYIDDGLLAHFEDRSGHEVCLTPTAEEVVTDLVRKDVRSYKQLPVQLYQIHWKFRDEIRPRFGLMRAREFLMKDAYSFDRDQKSAFVSYDGMYRAYQRIFQRCGLAFRAVEAATGAIGGSKSHEFQVLAETGEDAIVACNQCDYAANVELAAIAKDEKVEIDPSMLAPLARVATPGMKTIDEVSGFLHVAPGATVKTLVFQWSRNEKPADDEVSLVMALVPGDRTIAEEKVKKALGAKWLKAAAEADVAARIGPLGFLGPINAKSQVDVLADHAVAGMTNFVVGANEPDTHFQGANHGRDFTPTKFADLRVADAGDRCPRCSYDDKQTGAKARHGRLELKRGVEVGHVFYLGTKYSAAMKATFKSESGKELPFEMGCYGIGITRIAAAAIEQNHDKDGIIWPAAIAPFQVVVVTANVDKKEVVDVADRLYSDLLDRGLDVLYDDRAERAGFKFKDADLIGIPYRIIVGEKSVAEGLVEARIRRTGAVELVSPADAIGWVVERVQRDLTSALPASSARP